LILQMFMMCLMISLPMLLKLVFEASNPALLVRPMCSLLM
jgi:hypothetical protein